MYIQTTEVKLSGIIDYKGLDTSKIVPWTQVYDFDNWIFAVEVKDDCVISSAYIEITKDEYDAFKAEIEAKVEAEE